MWFMQPAVIKSVLLLTKGCKCKTGCTTARCGYWKKGQIGMCMSELPWKREENRSGCWNRGQRHTLSNIDSEMHNLLEIPTSDSECESVDRVTGRYKDTLQIHCVPLVY